jgi:hypothetical protein
MAVVVVLYGCKLFEILMNLENETGKIISGIGKKGTSIRQISRDFPVAKQYPTP